MLRRFLVFLVAFSGLSAWAECTQYQATWRGKAGPWSSSEQSACLSLNGMSISGAGGEWVSTTVKGAHVDQHGDCGLTETSLYTDSRTGLSHSVDFKTSLQLSTRTVEDCDSKCKELMGEKFTLNWTYGYTRTPSSDDNGNWKTIASPLMPPSDGKVCESGSSCKVALDLVPKAAWGSHSPTSQGLYRVSLDYDAMHLGESCTPSELDTAGASPAADKPTCPGFVGEVNGVPGCYGTASNPTSNDVSTPKPKPSEAGNPRAGEAPESGEGSGKGGASRTPSTGDGGPAGGPAAAAGSGTKPGTKPGDGDGDGDDDGEEKDGCGAPGQPKCRIDEGDTPGKFDGNQAALDDWKSAVEANRNTIKDTDGGFFDSFNLFFSAPPVVACEAIELPNQQSITRHCDVVDGTRSVMAYIWALAALWICLGWIREAI